MINKVGTYIAILSFLIGTLFLIIFYYNNSVDIILASWIFISIAAILNFGIILLLVVKIVNEKVNRKKHLRTFGLVLLNIPIAVLYFYFVVFLMNTMRITFVNQTGKLITDLKITSGASKAIQKLDIGESQTKWIEIVKDGSIRIDYVIEGETKSELVNGYTTVFSGKRIKYVIGK